LPPVRAPLGQKGIGIVYRDELSGSDETPIDAQDRRMAAIADALDAEMLDELEALWRRYRRRHPGLHASFERYGEIRAFAAQHSALGAAALRPSSSGSSPSAGAQRVHRPWLRLRSRLPD
jgi:hypothetical protein